MKGNSLIGIFFGAALILVLLINHEPERHEHIIIPKKYKTGINQSYDVMCLTDSVQYWNGQHKKTVRSMEYFE